MYLSAETGWRAERGGDQAEGGGAEEQGALRGSTPNPLVLYIEILVYTAFLSLRRNLFDGTGGLCGPRCWCWSGARISRRGRSGAGPGWLVGVEGGVGGTGAPRVEGAEAGLGCPSGSQFGDRSSRNLLLLYFLSSVCVGSVQHGQGGEVVGRLSHPAPLGPRARRPLRQHGGENKALGRPASAGAGV